MLSLTTARDGRLSELRRIPYSRIAGVATNDGNKISKDQVYKAFGKMKIYLSKDLSEEDFAKWLSSHVDGMASVSSWQRYL